MNKPANTSQPIHNLLRERWSPRAFDADKAVPATALTAMLEAARWAPSSFGEQPWFFVVCDKNTHSTAWEKALASLAAANQKWARQAPLLLLVCSDTLFSRNNKENRHHAYDSGAAALSLVLEAENQGLRAHQMSGFDPDAARAAFHVPPQYTCLAMIAVGYQAAAEMLEDDAMRGMETAARERRPLKDKFFFGDWGQDA